MRIGHDEAMQFPQLESFVTVARTRHFTQAADRLGVTQPTLSKQIRALENSLGTSLFVRERSGVTLTSAGEALLPHAERIVIDVETARRAVHEVTGLRRGRVRLGATPSLCDGVLPDVLTRFHATYPDLELEVREAGSPLLTRDLAKKLNRFRLSLCLAHFLVKHNGFNDLITRGVHWVERRHRFLEYHGNVGTTDGAYLAVIHAQQVLAFKQNS